MNLNLEFCAGCGAFCERGIYGIMGREGNEKKRRERAAMQNAISAAAAFYLRRISPSAHKTRQRPSETTENDPPIKKFRFCSRKLKTRRGICWLIDARSITESDLGKTRDWKTHTKPIIIFRQIFAGDDDGALQFTLKISSGNNGSLNVLGKQNEPAQIIMDKARER